MKLNDTIKNEIIDIVKMSFESGHFLFDEMEIAYALAETYPDKSNEEFKQLLQLCIEYHSELRDLGPAGFYEEFKDTLDFDPMFVEEYGDYYDEE